MIKKLLIANRGEIALRIIRSCKELGIATVAVHSEADDDALHVRLADQAIRIGPPAARDSYLKMPAVIAAAEVSGADAIHPGYGFLSENPAFAEICEKCRLVFVGPRPDDMRAWGDKIESRRLAASLGLPVLPGSDALQSSDEAETVAGTIGYPVILKASAGGGGRGMRIVRSRDELAGAFVAAQSEAGAAFGNPAVYLEKYIEAPRHIEFQVLGDGEGTVHVLGERECSVQRRHQKILEEAPSPVLSRQERERVSAIIQSALSKTRYRSAGTLEFLLDDAGTLHFIEMNTRIQVEHPVTEMVLGIDLVAEQLRIASGLGTTLTDQVLSPRGHAIECRINAEDPKTFVPWPGKILEYHSPGGAGVRVDTGVFGGYTVPKEYDSMLAKVICHGRTRQEAIARMKRSLEEMVITGIRTNIPLHLQILADPAFIRGEYSTAFLSRLLAG